MIPPLRIPVTVLKNDGESLLLSFQDVEFSVPHKEVWEPVDPASLEKGGAEVTIDGWWVSDNYPLLWDLRNLRLHNLRKAEEGK